MMKLNDNTIVTITLIILASPFIGIYLLFQNLTPPKDAPNYRVMYDAIEYNRQVCQNTRNPDFCKDEKEIRKSFGDE